MEQAPQQPAAPQQTVVTPPPASRILSESRNKPPKKHTGMIILIVVLVLLFGALGSAYAYFMRVPTAAVERSLLAMNDVDSYRSDVKIAIHVEQHTPEPTNVGEDNPFGLEPLPAYNAVPQDINIHMTGAIDQTNPDSPSFQTDVSIIGSEEGSKNTTAVELGLLGKDDIYYFNIKDIPSLGLFDLSSFTKQWIKVDLSDSAPEDSIGGLLKGLNEDLDELIDETDEEKAERVAKQEEIQSRLKALVFERPVFKVTGVNLPEFRDGAILSRISYELDKEALTSHAQTMINEFGEEGDAELLEELSEGLEAVSAMSGSMLIDKGTGFVHEMRIAAVITDKGSAAPIADVSAIITYSDHNEIILIEAPEESKAIEDVVEEVMGSFFGGLSMDIPEDDGTDTDGDGLSDYREYMLGLEENNPDTDGDGIPDGEDDEYNGNGYSYPINLDEDYSFGTFGDYSDEEYESLFDDSYYDFESSYMTEETGPPLMIDYAAGADDDGDGLSNDMELFLGSDPNNPDTDGDGYLDGEEVENGYSPIE